MKFTWYSAIAALTSSAILYHQYTKDGQDSTQLFLTEKLTQEEISFINWTTEHGKNYATSEEWKFRFSQFKKSLSEIAQHDEDYHGSSVGLNDFSDLTKEEWKKMLGYKQINEEALDEQGPRTEEISKEFDPNLQIKSSVDWRKEGAVNPVKSQGQCGSCWSFAAVAGLEGAYAVKYGKLLDFSEQYFVDCVKGVFCCGGCNGGLQQYAWKYLKDGKKGAPLQNVVPYNARDTNTCKDIDTKDQKAFVQKYENIDKNAVMFKVILNYRPITVAIEGENDFFRHYRGGVLKQGCGTNLDHAVAVVGYGTEKGQDYFIIRNSWGTTWGEKGYGRIAPDQCGILQMGQAVYVQ